MSIKAIILAGGMGKRLWPISREKWPKFMMKIGSGYSLLQQAYKRVEGIASDITVVSAKETGFLIEKEIKAINGDFSDENIRLEPQAKNTASAIMRGIHKCDDEDIIIALPADHVIEPVDDFKDVLRNAAEMAGQDHIVSIGVEPRCPATGYGYIKRSAETLGEGWKLGSFKEKPDMETAKKYIEEGGYYWNAGFFVFKAGIMKKEIEKYCSDITGLFNDLKDDDGNLEEIYEKLPGISMDYAVMENTDKAAVIAFNGSWDDLGCWEAVHKVLAEGDKPYSNGETRAISSKNSFIYTDPEKLTACIGIEDIIVIDSGDSILVMKSGEGQKVKDIVDSLKGRPETVYHMKDCRPWGGYRVLDEGEGYKTKILEIDPGQRLSLQKHEFRDEVWTVISGKAVITLGDKEVDLVPGETIKIPAQTLHRAQNRGIEMLRILELACGEKISEDDIIRVEDDYKR
ncbi:mannose-1-phosphate guanylyltransferase/mannose-6-phosphate isomerase [Elusimicrobiota bacterium]